MIRVSVIYNVKGDSTFDYAYYLKSHMPLAKRNLHPIKAEIDNVKGTGDGSPSPIHCIGHLYFSSMDDFQKSMSSPDAGPVMADVPNYYTGGAPTVLVSEIDEVPN